MKLAEFFYKKPEEINPKFNSFGLAGELALDRAQNYFLGVFNALTIFEGTIDYDMNIIEEFDFEFKTEIDRYTTLRVYIVAPKDISKVTVKDIDLFIEIEDKVDQSADLVMQIADYSFNLKDRAIGADYTKDFEEIYEEAKDALKILGMDKE